MTSTVTQLTPEEITRVSKDNAQTAAQQLKQMIINGKKQARTIMATLNDPDNDPVQVDAALDGMKITRAEIEGLLAALTEVIK